MVIRILLPAVISSGDGSGGRIDSFFVCFADFGVDPIHQRTAAGAGASFRVNSAVLLRYKIVAPLMITASRTISVSSMPEQDFIGRGKDAQRPEISCPPTWGTTK